MIRTLLTVSLLALANLAEAAPLRFEDCSKASQPTWCKQAQDQLRDAEKSPRTYQNMRNIAYCQWTGCDQAVAIDPLASCTLRRAIMKDHRTRLDSNDELHFANCVKAGH